MIRRKIRQLKAKRRSINRLTIEPLEERTLLATADIAIGTAVVAEEPPRLGTNIDNLGVGNIHHNEFTRGGGMEPLVLQSIRTASGGDEDTIFTGGNQLFEQVRTGFYDDATVRIYREENGQIVKVRDAIVDRYYAEDTDVDPVDCCRIELTETGPPVEAGDRFYLERHVDNLDPATVHERIANLALSDGWITGTAFTSSEFVSHEFDPHANYPIQPPDDGGHSSLRVTATADEPVWISKSGIFGTPSNNFLQLEPGTTYRVDMWLRQEGIANPELVFRIPNYRDDNQFRHTVTGITDQWQRFTWDFTPPNPPDPGPVGGLIMQYSGPGTLWLDNVRLYEADAEPDALKPRVIDAINDLNPGSVRVWSGWNNGVTLDNWTDPEVINETEWSAAGRRAIQELKLPTMLPVLRDAGADPWLIVRPTFSEAEWEGLIEYLAAPYDPNNPAHADRVWARKRYEQGQQQPWTEAFAAQGNRIHLELDNETWNGIIAVQPFVGEPEQYAAWANYWFGIAAASPYFNDDHIQFTLGGWTFSSGVDGYGATAIQNSPISEEVGLTNYVGGWEAGNIFGEGGVTDDGFQQILVHSPRTMQLYMNENAATRDALAEQGVIYDLMAYEGGPGYSAPGESPNPQAEAIFGKSLAAAVTTLDTMLYYSYQGVKNQNYFRMQANSGAAWSSHTPFHEGYRPHPSFLAMQIRNQHASGDMVLSTPIDVPTIDVESGGGRLFEAEDIPLVTTYAFRDGDKYSVVVLSRDLNETHDVTLHLPFDAATSTALHTLTGDPRDNNIDAMNIDIQEVTGVPNVTSDEYSFAMPPGSIYAFEFDGVTMIAAPTEPTVTVNKRSGQDDPTLFPLAQFQIVFSEPVEGFELADIQLTSPTPPEFGELVEVPGSQGMVYTYSLAGFDDFGPVSATIPAGVVQAVDDGAGNLASTGTDNVVDFIPRPVQDEVLLYEGFGNDPEASPFPGFVEATDTGYGWSMPWDDRNETDVEVVETDPLEYGDLTTTAPYQLGHFGSITREIDVHGSFREFEKFGASPATIGQGGTTLWASALLRKDTDSGHSMFVQFLDCAFNCNAGADDPARLSIGYFGSSSEQGGQAYWTLSVRNDSEQGGGDDFDQLLTDDPIVVGDTALAVLKFEFGTQDTISLYMNPDPASLGGAEPATADIVYPIARDLRFRTVSLVSGNPDNRHSIDEIRIGDSYAAVTTIDPPPPDEPLLITADAGAQTRVVGRLDHEPDVTYTVDFFASGGASFQPANARLLDSVNVTTDANGDAWFDLNLSVSTLDGEHISATLTDPTGLVSTLADAVVALTNSPPVALDDAFSTAADTPITVQPGDYSAAVLADGPIAYWHVNETTGDIAVNNGSLGASADGTYISTVDRDGSLHPIATGVPHFDGSNDRIEIPETAGINTGGPFTQRTIELVFKADVTGRRQVLFELGNQDRGMNVYLQNGELRGGAWNVTGPGPTSPWNFRSISTPIDAARLYHVAIVMDGNATNSGTFTGYLNGVQFDQIGGVGELHDPPGASAIGFQNGTGRYASGTVGNNPVFDNLGFFAGTVGEVAVYDAALTEQQIAAHWAASGLLANDTDPHRVDDFTVVGFDTVTARGATVNVNADGTFTYDPTTSAELVAFPTGAVAHDSFTYTVSDGFATGTATVTVDVTGTNDTLGVCGDLCPLNDEFDNAASIADWRRIYQVENWAADHLEAWDINTTQAGRMTMIPYATTWFQDYRGPMAFKEVTGDFAITTEVYVSDRDDVGDSDADDVPNGANFSLAGPLIRAPRNEINSPADWTPGGEDWNFLALGSGNFGANFEFEVKSTNNSQSNLSLSNAGTAGTAKLQLARIGDAVIALRQLPGEDWVVHRRFRRADFPETMQVGFVTYSNFSEAAQLSFFDHNNTAVTDGNPDLVAGFEYARYARPAVPADLQDVDLVDDATDDDLLRFLGEHLNISAPDGGLPPVAEAGGPYSTDEAVAVTLSAAGSSAPDGNILSYEWDLDNDGQFDDASGVTASFSAPDNGAFAVGLRVTDAAGLTDIDSATVTVNNLPPSADAGGPYDVESGGVVQLSGSGVDPSSVDVLTFTWDLDGDGIFGENGADATRGDEDSATPTFDASGMVGPQQIMVTLRVSDDDGDASTDMAVINVEALPSTPPTISAIDDLTVDEDTSTGPLPFTISDAETAAGQLVVTGSSSNQVLVPDGNIVFGGSGTDRTITVTPLASEVGTATITVAVTDEDSLSATESFILTVSATEPSNTTVLIVDDGDAGFSASTFEGFGVGYNQWVTGYEGDFHYHAASGGSHTATWTFDGLDPGIYQVAVTWVTDPNRATNSPFTVGGADNGGTKTIYQRMAPSSYSASFMDQGVTWVPLDVAGNGGNFQLSGSTLTVTLGTSTTGYVIADAVRIERVAELVSGPEIEVLDGGTSLSDGSNIDFGSVAQALPAVVRTFTVRNVGTATLDLGTLQISGGAAFSLNTSGLNATLGQNESTTFDVVLDTSTADSYTATVSIPSLAPNADADENPFQFTVEGTVDAPPPVGTVSVIDDGDAGFSAPTFAGFGVGYNQWVTGYEGDFHFHAASSGSHTATWTFDGLAPGIYQVAVTWVTDPNRATNAPFTVSGVDNGGTKTIYQRTAPSTYSASFEDQGVTWVPLDVGGNGGSFQLSGSTLTVTLGTSTTGYVIADAVRIERVGGLVSQPEIEVLDGSTSLSNGSNVDFGSVAQASPDMVRTITVKNVGTAPLNLGALQISGGAAFSLDNSGLDVTLDPNESTTFDVVLHTSTANSYTATVSIPSLPPNADADENPFQFTVAGTVDAPPPAGTVSIIDDGDAGFSAPAFKGFGVGYNQWVQGYQGNFHYHARTSVSRTATWTFDGLTAGMYQVAVTWATDPNRATDAPFTVSGVAGGGTVAIDQRQAPSSYSASFEDQGATWVPLDVGGNGGNFQLSGSTLTVTLGTSATGYVIADAVRIERLQTLRADAVIFDGTANVVTDATIEDALAAGTAEWSRVDPSSAARLAGVEVQVADLPGGALGLASASMHRIWLDNDAAGHGWSVGPETRVQSPESRVEGGERIARPFLFWLSALNSPLSFDLLTVMTHELGHVFGLLDLDPVDHPHSVMAGRLTTGVARHSFAADSTPSFDALAPWLDRTTAADMLFNRVGESSESEPGEMLRTSRALPFAPSSFDYGRNNWAIAERNEHEPFDRRTDDENDGITADVVFKD